MQYGVWQEGHHGHRYSWFTGLTCRIAEKLIGVSVRRAADVNAIRPPSGPSIGAHAKNGTLAKALSLTLAMQCLSSTLYWQSLRLASYQGVVFKETAHRTGQRRVDLDLKGNQLITGTLYYGKNVHLLERKCHGIHRAYFNWGERTHRQAPIFLWANEKKYTNSQTVNYMYFRG